jgi:hypothetical protein
MFATIRTIPHMRSPVQAATRSCRSTHVESVISISRVTAGIVAVERPVSTPLRLASSTIA